MDPPPHQQAPHGNFAGLGRTLGGPPTQSDQPTAPQSSQRPHFSEEDIKALTDLGVERAEAIQYLELAGGNVDAAASLLFQG